MLTADFKKMFEEISQNQVTDFESNYKTYDKGSREIIERHSPLITKTVKNNKDPLWMDAEYKLNRAKRRNLERRSKRNQELKGKYVEQRNLCVRMAINKQEDYYKKIISEAGGNQKALFKIANDLLDKKKVRILPEHEDPVKLANEFNKYYIEKIEKIRKGIPTTSDSVI